MTPDPEQYAAIMAGVKAESEANVAYDDARNAVIKAAQEVLAAWCRGPLTDAMFGPMLNLSHAVAKIDALEHAP